MLQHAHGADDGEGVESTAPLFRGRGRWMGDLALVAAAGLAARRRVWAVLLAIVALAASATVEGRSPALQVTAALVLAPLLRRSAASPGRSRWWRATPAVLGVGLLVALGYMLAGLWFWRAYQLLAGPSALVVCWLVAHGVRGDPSRRLRAILVALLVASLVAFRYRALSLEASTLSNVQGAFPFEAGALFLLAVVSRRGPWLLWTLVTCVLLKVVHLDLSGHEDAMLWLAGPLGVVFGARVGVALRHGVTISEGDAAAAGLARAIQHHPWRSTLLTSAAAFLVSFSFWISILEVLEDIVSPHPVYEPGWFAIPGPFTVLIAVYFHALGRAESLTDRLAAVVGPLLAVGGGMATIMFALALARGRPVGQRLEAVIYYTGLGPMLPALTGLAMARVARKRAATWPAAASVICALGIVVILLGSYPLQIWAEETLRAADVRSRVAPLLAIPWLLAFHRLVQIDVRVERIVIGALGLAVTSGVALLVSSTHGSETYGWGMSGDSGEAAAIAGGLIVLLIVTLGMGAVGVGLARRLRGITALPEDHAVLIWEEARRSGAGTHTT